MRHPSLLLAFLLGLGLRPAAGQDLSQIPPPHAPLLAAAPESGQWTITADYSAVTPPSQQNAPAGAPKGKPFPHNLQQIVTVKSGNLKHDVLTDRDGTSSEFWYANGKFILSRGPGGAVETGDARTFAPDPTLPSLLKERGSLTLSFGFPGFDWLKLKYYGAVVMENDVPCYHYTLQGGGTVAAEAWVNAKTNLPVKYSADGVTYTYAFGGEPGALSLPPDYEAAYQKLRQMQAYSARLQQDASHVMHP